MILNGSLAAGGPMSRWPDKPLAAWSTAVMALFAMVIFTASFSIPIVVGIVTIQAFAGAVGFVSLTSLIANETPAGAGTTMTLCTSMQSTGAAIGAAMGGVLLATGGYTAAAAGLVTLGVLSVLLVWLPQSQVAPPPPVTAN